MKLFYVLLSSIFIFHGINANPEGDALIAVKEALIDPRNLLNSWDNTLTTPCRWFHVTCNDNSEVIRLDLGNENLSGRLSPAIGRLTKLQYLDFSRNQIGGTIPKELENLSQLKSLILSNNQFSGCVDIQNLRNKIPGIIRLDVSNNRDLTICPPRIPARHATVG